MIKKILCLLSLVFVGFSLAQISEDSLEHMLQRAKTHYNSGEYESAINELESALQFLKQLESTDQIEYHKYLAFSYVALGDKDKAKGQFKKALMLDPTIALDPTFVSPKIIKVFEEAQAELKIKPTPIEPEPPKPARKKRVSKTKALMRSCCVPGWGQMYKGHSSKGKKIMIASGITFCTSVFSAIMNERAHNRYLDVPEGAPQYEFDDAYDRYKTWHNITAINLGLFGIVYAYNIYDVFFSRPATAWSLLDQDKGLYCESSVDRIRVGYKMNF